MDDYQLEEYIYGFSLDYDELYENANESDCSPPNTNYFKPYNEYPKLATFDEWSKMKCKIKKGSKCVDYNKNGIPVFSLEQVILQGLK